MHATGEYIIADLMEAFFFGRPGCLILQRHFVILRKSLRHYGFAKVIAM
jgi:hypothetical protein